MKSVSMTKRQWRVALDLMEQNREGYDRAMRRRLDDKIAPQMEDAMGEYYQSAAELVRHATMELRRLQAAGEPAAAAIRLNAQTDIALETLDLNGGQEVATVWFEETDFQAVKNSMPDKNLSGAKAAREIGIAIEDALESAKDVVPKAVQDEVAAKKNESSNGDDKNDSASVLE